MPHIPSLGCSHCEVILFRPFVFYPDKPIQEQITVNRIDTNNMNYVHDAAVSWIEDVTYEQFTACVMVAGYNERKSRANMSIDWIAYQGAPVDGVTGEVSMSQWWTETTCKTVNFPSVSIFALKFSIIHFTCFILVSLPVCHLLRKVANFANFVSFLSNNLEHECVLHFDKIITITKRSQCISHFYDHSLDQKIQDVSDTF